MHKYQVTITRTSRLYNGGETREETYVIMSETPEKVGDRVSDTVVDMLKNGNTNQLVLSPVRPYQVWDLDA